MAAPGSSWLPLTALVPDCTWLRLAAPGCSWLLLGAPGCSLLHLAALGYSWRSRLLLAGPSCLCLSPHTLTHICPNNSRNASRSNSVPLYHRQQRDVHQQRIATLTSLVAHPKQHSHFNQHHSNHHHNCRRHPRLYPSPPLASQKPPSTLPLPQTTAATKPISTSFDSPHGLASNKLYGNRNPSARAAISV